MNLCMMCVPRFEKSQRQTLMRECPRCGEQNDIGGLSVPGRLKLVCYSCKAPLYKRRTIKPKNTRKGKAIR